MEQMLHGKSKGKVFAAFSRTGVERDEREKGGSSGRGSCSKVLEGIDAPDCLLIMGNILHN